MKPCDVFFAIPLETIQMVLRTCPSTLRLHASLHRISPVRSVQGSALLRSSASDDPKGGRISSVQDANVDAPGQDAEVVQNPQWVGLGSSISQKPRHHLCWKSATPRFGNNVVYFGDAVNEDSSIISSLMEAASSQTSCTSDLFSHPHLIASSVGAETHNSSSLAGP